MLDKLPRPRRNSVAVLPRSHLPLFTSFAQLPQNLYEFILLLQWWKGKGELLALAPAAIFLQPALPSLQNVRNNSTVIQVMELRPPKNHIPDMGNILLFSQAIVWLGMVPTSPPSTAAKSTEPLLPVIGPSMVGTSASYQQH